MGPTGDFVSGTVRPWMLNQSRNTVSTTAGQLVDEGDEEADRGQGHRVPARGDHRGRGGRPHGPRRRLRHRRPGDRGRRPRHQRYGVRPVLQRRSREARKLGKLLVGDRMWFEVGDLLKLDLPAADIVVINRVACCYPRHRQPAGTTRSVRRGASCDDGAGLERGDGSDEPDRERVENIGYRLRPRKYGGSGLHPRPHLIDERIRAAGFPAGFGTNSVASCGTSGVYMR